MFQIETLKGELTEEKNRHKDTKKQMDDKVRQLTADSRVARQELEEKRNVITDLEGKVSDLDDKWSKSKRINTQRKEKMDALEIQVENLKAATLEMDSLKKKLAETKTELDAKESKVVELERAQSSAKKTWGSNSSGNASLQAENDELKKQIEELKKKANNPVSRSREVQELRQVRRCQGQVAS